MFREIIGGAYYSGAYEIDRVRRGSDACLVDSFARSLPIRFPEMDEDAASSGF